MSPWTIVCRSWGSKMRTRLIVSVITFEVTQPMTTVRQRYGYGQTDTQTTLAQQYRAWQYMHHVLKAQSIQYATKKLIRMPGPYPEINVKNCITH